MSWYQRLTSLDVLFLDLESRATHMHVGALAVFEGPAPAYTDLRRMIEARLEFVPRYRQRLLPVPFHVARPVWIDDAQFDLDYHLRHTALPSPGGQTELKRLCGRLMSQQLDRNKPLWELWFVEGLEGGRFAIVSKTHHCMIDGVSGVDLATVLLDVAPNREPPPPGKPWEPRPAPTREELLAESLREQLLHPIDAVKQLFANEGQELRARVAEAAAGAKPLLGMLSAGLAADTSLNVSVGPHRRFETLQLPLAAIKRVRQSLGGTVNDVLLAVVAGGLRRLLEARGDALPDELRVMVPVSVRAADARGTFGNQVTAVFCPLPVAEPDPTRRLARVSESMRGLKETTNAVGARALVKLADFAPPTLLSQAARLQAVTRLFNLVVTNVPGPQFPLYLLGSKMLGCYPVVPLAQGLTIGVALLSYDGHVGVGLLGDADAARDLGELPAHMEAALAELGGLAKAAGLRPQASGTEADMAPNPNAPPTENP